MKAWADKSHVYWEVRDEGFGISEDDQSRIFEKFYRSPHLPDSAKEGSGIGLTLVKHIVEAHGGRISVESVPKRGSAFTIKIPRNADD